MPQFTHPSVSTRIVDNSHTFRTSDGQTVLFQCIVSDTGPDNRLVRVTTPDEYLFYFGAPNLAKHGQAPYNVIRWLQSGGTAFVLRVLPEDATFAYTGICATVDIDSDTKTAVVVTEHLSDGFDSPITSEGAMDLALEETHSVSASKVVVPLGLVYPKGRGEGYNNLGVRFSLKTELDKTFDFRTYGMTITAKDSMGSDVILEGPFTVSFDPLAKNQSRQSLFWEDVINKYAKFVTVKAVRSAQEDIADALLTLVDDADEINAGSIDILFGQPRNVEEADIYGSWTWVNKQSEATAEGFDEETLFDTRGSALLRGGSDGTWEDGNSRDSLLTLGYGGLIDPSVLDTQFFEFDVVLDGNESPAVKSAMSDLSSNLRGDCITLLDLGFQATPAQCIDARRDDVGMSTYHTSVWAQDMEIFDAFNGNNIRVTTPYILASKIPEIDRDFGIQWSFVGPRRGVVSGVSDINFIPNSAWKEELYKAQINYIERDPKKTSLATHTTSQVQTSALSAVPNVRVVLKIRRDVQKMMADYRMEFQDDLTYDSMSSDLNGYLQKWTANRACSSIEGEVYASEYDRQQGIARVRISLVFTGFIERVAIDIIVNR